MADFNESVKLLKTWRDTNQRKSREVYDLWINHILTNVNQLGRDKFIIYEQVIIACLDCGKYGTANNCITELFKEFPNSSRVKRLEAMYYEAKEKYNDANLILDKIIENDETNSGARKRKIAILKAQGKTFEAIKELTEYLKIFMADTEAWQELSELYINEQDFNKAAFCMEELILHNPHNHLLHQRYADIKYTQGGLENIELAKSYYSQAIKLNSKNIRAHYGLYLTTTAITMSPKCTAQKKKECLKLTDWVLNQLKNFYKNTNNENLMSRLEALKIN